jgi:hypothetical protein
MPISFRYANVKNFYFEIEGLVEEGINLVFFRLYGISRGIKIGTGHFDNVNARFSDSRLAAFGKSKIIGLSVLVHN